MSVLARSELGPGSGSDSQNPGPNQNLARMAVLAKSWFGPGFWLRSMVGPESWNLDKIATLLKSRDSVQNPDFWIRSWILPDPIPDPYMSTLSAAYAHTGVGNSTQHHVRVACPLHACHMYTYKSCQRQTLACVHFGNIRSFLLRMIVFDHSCALKIIFGISSRYEMLFLRGCVCVASSMFCLLTFLPHITSEAQMLVIPNIHVVTNIICARYIYDLAHLMYFRLSSITL